MNNWRGEFRGQVLQLLADRNKKEKGFTELFKHHERLFENWAAVRAENIRLSMQVERGYISGGEKVGGGSSSDEREKILALQEELTELHRKRGENASQVLSVSSKLTEKESELAAAQAQNAELVVKNADLEDREKFLNSQLQELEATNELLRDEHSALHLAYTALEDNYRKTLTENKQLVQRYIDVKAQHADVMNLENENFMKKKRAEVQKELEEAAAEIKTVVLPGSVSTSIAPPSDVTILSSLAVHCVAPTQVAHKFEAHESEVQSIRWAPNGRNFATGGMDRKVKIWECIQNGVELRGMLTGSNGSVLSIDFDSTGSLVLATSSDFACRVWTAGDLRLRHTLTGHSGKVLAARFMGDPHRVVSGSHDRTLKVWDLRSRACVSTKFAGSSCNDLVCIGDGSTSVISGHFDKRIRFWDFRKSERTESPTQEVSLPGKITSLDLSKDQNFLLASGRDDSIEVLDLRMNSVIGQYIADGFKISSDFSRACFSPDGQFIACGSADGSVYVWNMLENKVEIILKEHTSAVGAVHWQLQKGVALLSADRSKKVVIWTP